MKAVLLVCLCILAGSCLSMNTAKLMDWYLYNTGNSSSPCTPLSYDSCVQCGYYWYQPSQCYGFEECYYSMFYDSSCQDLIYDYYYAQENDCGNYNYYGNFTECNVYWRPPPIDCDGCTAPVFTVQSDVGVSVYHLPYSDGPSYISQTSANEASVTGRISGHYYMDGYGRRVAVEGFLDEDTYLTTAGYCDVGQWCNSTTTMQYKLDFQSVSVSLDGNYLGFHPYAAAAFESDNYSETPVNVVVPTGNHVSYLSVDAEWDLTNFEIELDFVVGSISGLLPIIIHNGSGSLPQGARYNDMLYVPRGSNGVLAYNFNIASFEIYRRGGCEGQQGYSSSFEVPVCYMDGSFDNDFMVDRRLQSTDEMTFTLL